MKMNIAEVVTKFWEYATNEVENKYQHDVIKGAAYREGIFNGILYASQVEPIPTGKEVSAEKVLDILTNTPAINFDCDNYPKCECDGYCTNISAMAKKIASQFKGQPIEEGVSFKQSDWDAFKLRMGDRNYQGVINIEDFVKIIGELEDKKLKSKEEGVSKEADKIQKAIEWCEEGEKSYLTSTTYTTVKKYLLSIK